MTLFVIVNKPPTSARPSVEFHTDTLLSVVAILIFWFILDRYLSFQLKLRDKELMDEAKDLLEDHGYSVHLYLPSIGFKDNELARAICRVSDGNFIILDREGRMVGKAVPNMEKENHTSLRFVVDRG